MLQNDTRELNQPATRALATMMLGFGYHHRLLVPVRVAVHQCFTNLSYRELMSPVSVVSIGIDILEILLADGALWAS